MSDKPEKNKDAMRITGQSRSRRGMVYDLKANGQRLTLSVFPRESQDEPAEWRVEARASSSAEEAVVTHWAATRQEALQEVARMWSSKAESAGLATFDWEAVAQALTAVRAI